MNIMLIQVGSETAIEFNEDEYKKHLLCIYIHNTHTHQPRLQFSFSQNFEIVIECNDDEYNLTFFFSTSAYFGNGNT